MKCPICKDVDLLMSERAGVEIDYCPSCRGIWLDRGELDKIVEGLKAEETNNRSNYHQEDERRYDQKHHEDKYYDDKHNKKHRKKSKMLDIFERFEM